MCDRVSFLLYHNPQEPGRPATEVAGYIYEARLRGLGQPA